MKMRVDAEQCIGCGACIETCPNGAIQLKEGLAIFEQAACTQCQSCVDACPVGAITAVELPVAIMKPATIQPVREAEVVVAQPVPSSPKPWLSAALVFAGREILPRLADALLAALDRRLAQAQLALPDTSLRTKNTEISSRQNNGSGYRRRSRYGLNRQRWHGQGRGTGKRNWFLMK